MLSVLCAVKLLKREAKLKLFGAVNRSDKLIAEIVLALRIWSVTVLETSVCYFGVLRATWSGSL